MVDTTSILQDQNCQCGCQRMEWTLFLLKISIYGWGGPYSYKICYKVNYGQAYLRQKIVALQNKMWRDNNVKFRKHIKLEVLRQC
jgi:hypothetical protein